MLAASSILATCDFSMSCIAATYGNATPLSSITSEPANVVRGIQVIIPEPLTLDSFGLMYGNPGYPKFFNGSRAVFGLYDSTGVDGNPGALMATTGIVNLAAIATYTVDFSSHPTVPAATYWMMALYESRGTPRSFYPGDVVQVAFRQPFAEGMPTVAPAGSSTVFTTFNYWINGIPVPEPATFVMLCPVLAYPIRRRQL
jgi:hypothetical protein